MILVAIALTIGTVALAINGRSLDWLDVLLDSSIAALVIAGVIVLLAGLTAGYWFILTTIFGGTT